MPLTTKELANKARMTHGLIAHNAALADSCLYEAFHCFTGCKREVSRAIYFTLDAAPGHAALVRRAAVASGADAATVQLAISLGEAVKNAISHRNGFAHSFLLFHEDVLGIDDHIKFINPKNQASVRVTELSLSAAEGESAAHLKKVSMAFQELCLKLGIPPEVAI